MKNKELVCWSRKNPRRMKEKQNSWFASADVVWDAKTEVKCSGVCPGHCRVFCLLLLGIDESGGKRAAVG